MEVPQHRKTSITAGFYINSRLLY